MKIVNYSVSGESLQKVRIHFITEVKRTGNREVLLTSVTELAERCGISVATAKKSNLVLSRFGIIKRSRKDPNLYVYKGDLSEFDNLQDKIQNEYLPLRRLRTPKEK